VLLNIAFWDFSVPKCYIQQHETAHPANSRVGCSSSSRGRRHVINDSINYGATTHCNHSSRQLAG